MIEHAKDQVQLRFQAKAHDRDGRWDLEVTTTIAVGELAPEQETTWFGPFATRAAALEHAAAVRLEMQRRLDARLDESGAAPGQWFDNKRSGVA